MRSDIESKGQTRTSRPSFIEEARRRQIVHTAIETIASQGFSQASLAEIARKAGISKGVISYHFAGKQELIREILESLVREPAEFIKDRVSRCDGALDKLAAYVRANFEFMKHNRDGYVALVDLWGQRGLGKADDHFNAEAYEPSRRYLGKILETGQRSGELRALPIPVTASIIQAAIDGVMLQWVFDPSFVDLDTATDEIVDMVHRYASPPTKTKPNTEPNMRTNTKTEAIDVESD